MKTKIKICGLKSHNDVTIVNKYLPDYVGFVFAPSKRQVSLELAKQLIDSLDKKCIPVGVFVNADFDLVMDALAIGIQGIQLHGDETVEYIKNLKKHLYNRSYFFWKALRIENRASLKILTKELVETIDGILLDAYNKEVYGGSGDVFNWDLANEVIIDKPIILAGGLTKDNVLDAISKVKPYCVDISSGVETDGNKDEGKIKDFMKIVRP